VRSSGYPGYLRKNQAHCPKGADPCCPTRRRLARCPFGKEGRNGLERVRRECPTATTSRRRERECDGATWATHFARVLQGPGGEPSHPFRRGRKGCSSTFGGRKGEACRTPRRRAGCLGVWTLGGTITDRFSQQKDKTEIVSTDEKTPQ